MSYTLRVQIGGWGSVRNPLNEDETVDVRDDTITVVDGELARALEREYDPLVIVETPDEGGDEPVEEEPEDESSELSGRPLPVDPYDLSVTELYDWAANTEDPEKIDIVLEYEREGKNRSSAIDRLEQRRGALDD